MNRIRSAWVIWILCSASQAPALAQPPQSNHLALEILQLKQKAEAQETRIGQLEKAMKDFRDNAAIVNRDIVDAILKVEQAVKDIKAIPAPRPIPPVTPAWRSASNWNLVKKGMSRAEVTDILGAPARETSVLDTQTLYYRDGDLNGSLTLVGDRLTAMVPPMF